MRILVGLIGTASFLFIIGGFGTIVTLIVRADPDMRAFFGIVFLTGLIPTILLLMLGLGIGIYHFYLYRIQGKTPTGWLDSEKHDVSNTKHQY